MSYSSGLYFSVPTRISHYLEESNSYKASKLILWVPSFWSIPKWKDHSVVFCISNRNKYWKFFLQLYNLNIIHNSKMIALYLIFLGNNNKLIITNTQIWSSCLREEYTHLQCGITDLSHLSHSRWHLDKAANILFSSNIFLEDFYFIFVCLLCLVKHLTFLSTHFNDIPSFFLK